MKRYSFSVSDERGAELEAYAEVKGLRSVGNLASMAVENLITRNPPTRRQQARMAALVDKGRGPRFALLHEGSGGNLKEG